MAEEGTIVEAGDPLLDFDNSSLADQVRTLEIQILEAETRIEAPMKKSRAARGQPGFQSTSGHRGHYRICHSVDSAVVLAM